MYAIRSYYANITTDVRPNANSISDECYFLKFIKGGYATEYNFHELEHQECNLNLALVENRIAPIQTLAVAIHNAVKDGMSESTAENYFLCLRRYIKFCDNKCIEPFSKQGYLAFCGSNGELWRLVHLGAEPKRYLFMYQNMEETGIQEKTAAIV